MVKALFAGSFDPPTYGHLDVILRSSKIFTELHVLLAINKRKNYLFTVEERLKMLKVLTAEYSNVSVFVWDSLIVEYAKTNNIKVLVRGVRNVSDFSYEFDLALLNRGLDKEIETLFLPPDPRYFVLRSSSIRELASLGGDLSSMVPPIVEEKLKEKVALNYL
ncbi:MAG: pantetheine-phosphate adenylyltransferase [Treponema sp.]